MTASWPLVSLADLYDIRSGLSKPAKDFGNGFPFLSFKDVFHNFFVPDKLTGLVQTNERERESCSIKRGDVFLTRTSETIDELGMSCVALKDYDQATFNGFTKRLRPKKSTAILPEYVGYYLRSPFFRNEMMAFSTLMSTRASLNNEMISHLKLPMPPKRAQQDIAHILKSFDDKIELNNQTNQTLEQISQAVFKSWFVDFEPVKAKEHIRKLGGSSDQIEKAARAIISGAVNLEDILNGSNLADIDGIINSRLDKKLGSQTKKQKNKLQETATLFPDRFVESELGLIPKGWGTEKLEKGFNITMGQSPPGHTYNENKLGMAFFQGRRDFGWRYPKNRVYCTEPKRKAKAGDTLLSVRAPVGDINLAAIDCCIGRGLAAIRHKSGCEIYTYYSMTELKHRLQFCYSDGTIFNSINQKDLRSIRLIRPPSSIVSRFGKMLKASEKQIRNNKDQSDFLIELRDTLLPKLLSGEIQINT